MPDLWATAIGAVAAGTVAGTAWRTGSLTTSGAAAAMALGSLAAAAGAGWAVLLIGYFVSSTALSRAGAARKAARTAGITEKGGARDAAQVLANGGAFGVAAAGWLWTRDAGWGIAAAGALAASAADTWATEIGTWIGGRPRHVVTWRPLETGLSGGVTAAGSLAMGVGAAAMALLALVTGVVPAGVRAAAAVAAVVAGGVAGAVLDSVLGATVQERRRCADCGATTEQHRHTCGAETVRTAGVAGVGNDLVNAAATVTGAAVAAWVALRAG